MRPVSLLALATVLLGGCVLGPDYVKPPAVADAAMQAPALHRDNTALPLVLP
ncbi:hypothetical protein HH299_11615 [Xanthomonas sp. Kuri4-2]